MSLWTMVDNSGGKPKYANTSEKALIFGIDTTEAHSANGRIAHAGWVRVEAGTGPVASIAITTPGTLYANTDALTFTGGGGTGAAGHVVTDGAGIITGAVITAAGSGYTSKPTVGITTSTGSGGALTAVMGGRAGRTKTEVMVAGGSMTGDADGGTF